MSLQGHLARRKSLKTKHFRSLFPTHGILKADFKNNYCEGHKITNYFTIATHQYAVDGSQAK
jgi:hypothetical protein